MNGVDVAGQLNKWAAACSWHVHARGTTTVSTTVCPSSPAWRRRTAPPCSRCAVRAASSGRAPLQRLYGLPLLLQATPFLIAAVGRRAKLRADQHAAALGFARELAVGLETMYQADGTPKGGHPER
ncbi:hypothetical protein SALBM311S_06468 [Streptomyces alboniger]